MQAMHTLVRERTQRTMSTSKRTTSIPALALDQASPAAAAPLQAVQKMLGGVPNMFRVAAQAPAALEALVGMFGATSKASLRPAVREQIALTVAQVNACDYCLSAHTALGKRATLSDAEMTAAR